MARSRRKRATEEAVELNITAFLNLMVILVPFLLITAVFSRMTVLELQLPPLGGGSDPSDKSEEDKLELQVLISPDLYLIQDPKIGVIKRIDRKVEREKIAAELRAVLPGGFSEENSRRVLNLMSQQLLEIKRQFPDTTEIALLFDSRIPYRDMIAVMDHVRSVELPVVGGTEVYELFPDISIGDAPLMDNLIGEKDEQSSLSKSKFSYQLSKLSHTDRAFELAGSGRLDLEFYVVHANTAVEALYSETISQL